MACRHLSAVRRYCESVGHDNVSPDIRGDAHWTQFWIPSHHFCHSDRAGQWTRLLRDILCQHWQQPPIWSNRSANVHWHYLGSGSLQLRRLFRAAQRRGGGKRLGSDRSTPVCWRSSVITWRNIRAAHSSRPNRYSRQSSERMLDYGGPMHTDHENPISVVNNDPTGGLAPVRNRSELLEPWNRVDWPNGDWHTRCVGHCWSVRRCIRPDEVGKNVRNSS
jgi:hypothetical protein